MSERMKQEVLEAFQKVSPSKIGIEDEAVMEKYTKNHYNLFFHKLHFPPELFKGKKILDFGCGTGEADVVLAKWGGYVEGFDFNEMSIKRANELKKQFSLDDNLNFYPGDVETYNYVPGAYDIVISMGVIAHVPNQKLMLQRMTAACKRSGFIILGYIEDAGLIQRLLHRAIIMVNSDKSDEQIFLIAKMCFAEHIERSVKYGGRSAEGVINDYLVNPHYWGISLVDMLEWADENGLEFYSMWPNSELPFVVDSPYFKPIGKRSNIYKKYISLLRLRWLYAQDEDAKVFDEIITNFPDIDKEVATFFERINDVLQKSNYSTDNFNETVKSLKHIEKDLQSVLDTISLQIKYNFHDLNEELLRILGMIIEKGSGIKEFDLNHINRKLFKGYNGLGTSYIIFSKSSGVA